MSDSHDDQPDWNFGERDVIEKLKLYVWSAPPMFYAVAHARSVAHARELMLGQIGESGDGSCAERDKARERILTQTPSIWAGPNAEFALTDSAELAEADAHRETLEATIKTLTAKLAEKEAELAEAQRYAVAESSKAHQEIIELRAQNRKLEAELEAARSAIRTHPHGVFGDCRYNERATKYCTDENCIWTRLAKEPR